MPEILCWSEAMLELSRDRWLDVALREPESEEILLWPELICCWSCPMLAAPADPEAMSAPPVRSASVAVREARRTGRLDFRVRAGF